MKHFNEFSENELISYIKIRHLSSVTIFVLDILCPFNKILASVVAVSRPLLGIFFNSENIESGIVFLEDRARIRNLKKKLLEES